MCHKDGPAKITLCEAIEEIWENPTYIPAPLMENPEVRKRILSRIQLGRLGKQEETAAVVAFLASEKSSFITGHVIPMTGGWV